MNIVSYLKVFHSIPPSTKIFKVKRTLSSNIHKTDKDSKNSQHAQERFESGNEIELLTIFGHLFSLSSKARALQWPRRPMTLVDHHGQNIGLWPPSATMVF